MTVSKVIPTLDQISALIGTERTTNGGIYGVVIKHGATASTARLTTSLPAFWIGTVAPANTITDDLWYDQTTETLRRWSGTAWLSATGKGPSILLPFGPAVGSATAWPLANRAMFAKINPPGSRPYRYYRFAVGTASGNIQASVVKLRGTGLTAYDRVMTSGVIACPASGQITLDLGSTLLSPSDYAVALWCDNVTATLSWSTSTGNIKRMNCGQIDGLATNGVPINGEFNGTSISWGNQGLIDVALTADV